MEVRGTLSHRSACHGGLLETLEPPGKVGGGENESPVTNVLGNLTHSKMPDLCPGRARHPSG